MPIDPHACGLSAEPREVSWTDRDTLLYALGVGCGPERLAFVTENSKGLAQRVLPTFAVIACDANPVLAMAGTIDWPRLVHGAQSIRLHGPLSPAGTLRVVATIVDIQDKGPGKNAVVVVAAQGFDPAGGAVVVETTSTLVIRGAGGFGGEPGTRVSRVEAPDREPDVVCAMETRPDQPLIYRLSGDRNPLHSDPWFARERAGFDRPIMHGLCTYGFAGRALVANLCDDDPALFTAMSARFAAPVYPGETLTTRIWKDGAGSAMFTTVASGSEGSNARVVLDNGQVEYLT
jgi:acyl dehydratase